MKKDIFIITGASRGIGKAIAMECSGEENMVITISRSELPSSLLEYFKEQKTEHYHYQQDLSDPGKVEDFCSTLFNNISRENCKSLLLVNNAAMLEPVAPAGKGSDALTASHIQLNLIAPMLLTSAMIRVYRDWDIEKTVLNISSGAASNPYYGWSSYCSSKAGLAMFTRCVALEQEETQYPVRILAIGPGVVDTEMQDTIRSKSTEEFKMLNKFIELKEKGRLQDPGKVAKLLLKVVDDDRIPSGDTSDLRELV